MNRALEAAVGLKWYLTNNLDAFGERMSIARFDFEHNTQARTRDDDSIRRLSAQCRKNALRLSSEKTASKQKT